jgi:hypothetical protein
LKPVRETFGNEKGAMIGFAQSDPMPLQVRVRFGAQIDGNIKDLTA